MKTKIITTNQSNVLKTESRADSNKKIALLTEKLANHFKIRLSSLITEKNYKFSSMVTDIGTFVKKLENSNYETETVVPRLEKYLLEIISKMSSESTRHLPDMNKINQILKTDLNPKKNNNLNGNHNINYDRTISTNKSANLISPSTSDQNNIYLADYYTTTLPDEANKGNVLNKPGAYLSVNSSLNAKSEVSKNKIISKTDNKNNILNMNNKGKNNTNNNPSKVIQINSYNQINKKNERSNNLVTDNKYYENNPTAVNNNIPTMISTDNTNEYQSHNNNLMRSYSTKQNLITNNSSNVSLTQKTEKLNDLKEKALDEWAMIVKYNHLKHLEEEQNRKNIDELKKKRVKEILENQMKEKDELKRLKQEEDKRFFKKQTEIIENMEKDHLEKERARIEKVKIQKENQEKLIKG